MSDLRPVNSVWWCAKLDNGLLLEYARRSELSVILALERSHAGSDWERLQELGYSVARIEVTELESEGT